MFNLSRYGSTTIKLRRGPTSGRRDMIPAPGELILDTTSNLLYVGDGITKGGILIPNGGGTIVQKIEDGDLKMHSMSGSHPKFIIEDHEDLL